MLQAESFLLSVFKFLRIHSPNSTYTEKDAFRQTNTRLIRVTLRRAYDYTSASQREEKLPLMKQFIH